MVTSISSRQKLAKHRADGMRRRENMNSLSLILAATSLIAVQALAQDSAGKPVPRQADGHPDFNGTWDNGSGIDFINPQKSADGSICVAGCATPASQPATPRPPPPAPDRPRYKPDFVAKVKDLEKH